MALVVRTAVLASLATSSQALRRCHIPAPGRDLSQLYDGNMKAETQQKRGAYDVADCTREQLEENDGYIVFRLGDDGGLAVNGAAP